MAEPHPPPPVKLICGLLAASDERLTEARTMLAEAFGPIDLTGEVMDFPFTDYYDAQMGSPLLRQFVAFEKLVPPESLVEAKLATNELERRLAARQAGGPPRPVNLDPGYLESGKLILASMKNFSHRVYLSGGVYAEVTLMFRHGRWRALEWTFPDYASGRYDAFLTAARTRMRRQWKTATECTAEPAEGAENPGEEK